MDVQQIFQEMGCKLDFPPEYAGGELVAATGQTIRRMAGPARTTFDESVERFHAGKLKFNEEAQLLSYLYYSLGLPVCNADHFARRIWTDVHFRNGNENDRLREILHLPSEKRFGFSTLYTLVRDPSSWFYEGIVDEKWLRRVHRIVGVPRPSLWKMAVEVATYTTARLRRLVDS